MQTEQLELEITPNTVIPILKSEIASRDQYRKITKRGRETYNFPVDLLEVRPGFNGRTLNNPGFLPENIEKLAVSILDRGLEEPITIDAIRNAEGTIIKGLVNKGERRLLAHKLIRSWIKSGNISKLLGQDVKDIPSFDFIECFINPSHLSEIDRTVNMLLENDKFPLSPMEHAEAIARLSKDGMSQAQIAKAIPGLSTMMVSLRLKLASASEEEKQLIKEGKISPTAATKLISEESDPEKRIAMINEAAEGEDGKLKIKAIGDDQVDTETGEVLNEEDKDNSLRDGDLTGASSSEPIDPKDDPSLKGTSPKASTPSGDPAQKAKDQIDSSDDRIISGKATAFDLVIKVMGIVKQFDLETEGEQKNNPKLTTLIFEADKVLYDLKAILKK